MIIGDELGRQVRPGLGISKFEQIMIDHLPPFELLTVLRQLGQKVPSCSRILQSWIMRPLANWTLTVALSMPRFTARRLKTLISSIEILLSDDLTRFGYAYHGLYTPKHRPPVAPRQGVDDTVCRMRFLTANSSLDQWGLHFSALTCTSMQSKRLSCW